jgi:hypothetical protein
MFDLKAKCAVIDIHRLNTPNFSTLQLSPSLLASNAKIIFHVGQGRVNICCHLLVPIGCCSLVHKHRIYYILCKSVPCLLLGDASNRYIFDF